MLHFCFEIRLEKVSVVFLTWILQYFFHSNQMQSLKLFILNIYSKLLHKWNVPAIENILHGLSQKAAIEM